MLFAPAALVAASVVLVEQHTCLTLSNMHRRLRDLAKPLALLLDRKNKHLPTNVPNFKMHTIQFTVKKLPKSLCLA